MCGMRACLHACTHNSCQLSMEHEWGPPSSKCNLSLGPVSPWRPTEGGALGRKRQRPGGQRVGAHPRTPPPPSVNIRGWLNVLASFLPSPPIVQHHLCSHRQQWEGQLQQSVSENADTVFYTRLLQASKCYINKAEQILSLPSCTQ